VQRSHKGAPKSVRSRRRVPLLAAALEALRAQLAHARGEGDPTGPDDLVWPSATGLQRARNDDFGWSSRKRPKGEKGGYRVALGIARYVRFHDLRATAASHMVMGSWTLAPMELVAVQAWMGHANISTTMIYAHLAPGYLHDRVRGANGGGSGGGVGHGTSSSVPRVRENAAPEAISRASQSGSPTRCGRGSPSGASSTPTWPTGTSTVPRR